ncbi:MAG: hypothetical protein AAF203_00400 [Pseudomonadota bacterium]
MFKTIKKCLLLICLQVTLLSIPQGLQAQMDPAIEWKQIETEDAYWLFDAKHQALAEYYILQFKRAKREVLGLFKEPSSKMTIILIDNTDIANGSAQVSPQPIIRLLTVSPTAYSSIGEFNNQIHELLAHEYTHILNMDPVHGWISPLYYIFGSIAHPNMLLPRWYTEGLAVYTESLLSNGGGRLSSQYLEGLARSLTLDKKWDRYPLSDLNDFHPDWLGGSRAYLFGGILWESIAREKGVEIIEKFNQSYSRRLPYLIHGVSESYLGVDYDEQLAKAYQYWIERSQKQIDVIKQTPQMNGALAKNTDGRSYAPSISPDGLWMAFINDDDKGTGHVKLTLRHPKNGFLAYKAKQVVTKARALSLAWHPAATGFVYEKLSRHNFYNRFYDLYFYDLKTKKSERITKGRRAHHACFSPKGDRLYYLSNHALGKRVVMREWDSKKEWVLYKGAIGDDLRYLNCLGNKALYFVEHIPDQKPTIARLDLKTGKKTTLFAKEPVRFLQKTHRGLLFTSNQSGVENLYLIERNSRLKYKAITNSLTRVQQGALDPLDDRLYFTQLTSRGPKIYSLRGAQWESLPDRPPKIEPIAKFEKLAGADEDFLNDQADEKEKYKVEDFSPWRYLYPNHWIPFFFLVDGGAIYQALTSMGDPLGINSVSLVGQYDTLTNKAGISASYINNSYPVSLGLGVAQLPSFFFPTQSTLNFTNLTALAATRFAALDNARIRFQWNYSALDFGTDLFLRQGPQLEVGYSSTKRNNNDISASSGWRFQLGHKNFLADLGNQSYGETYSHLGSFWSSFTPNRHVFYLGINASYAPQLDNAFFATSTLAGPFQNPQITNTSFLQRGYPTGLFIARNIVNTNAEYRFPIASVFSGLTTPPVFLKNLQGSFVFDATTLDGRYSNSVTNSSELTEIGRWFTGYGLELESNIAMGFHVPVTLTLGLYYGEDQQSFGGFTTFFNVRL